MLSLSRKALLGLSAVLGIALLSSSAIAAPKSGLYLAATGGWTSPDGDVELSDLEGEDTGSIPDQNLDLDEGYSVTFAVGWDFGTFRVEGEGSYRENDVNELERGGFVAPGASADFQASAVMANAIVDIPVTDVIGFYAGAGAGLAAIDIETQTLTEELEIVTGALAYQLLAGAQFQVTDNVAITIGYRLWSTFNSEFDGDDWDDDDDDDDDEEDLEGEVDMPLFHTFELGLRYTF